MTEYHKYSVIQLLSYSIIQLLGHSVIQSFGYSIFSYSIIQLLNYSIIQSFIMAHTAQLRIESKEYTVIESEYEFVQPIKGNGIPAGQPTGGVLHFTVVSPDNSDLFLHDWMQSATEQKDGKITFSVVDTGKPSIKTLHFKRAYCVRLYEYFSGQGTMQMVTKITISAAEISFGEGRSIVFKNDGKA